MNDQQKHLLNEVKQVIDHELANGKLHSCAEYDERLQLRTELLALQQTVERLLAKD